jgi:copper chaperone
MVSVIGDRGYVLPVVTNLRITGMTCNHCVHHVGDALRAVPGVSAVDVELEAGRAKVVHDAPIEFAQLVRAVESAGYEAALASD